MGYYIRVDTHTQALGCYGGPYKTDEEVLSDLEDMMTEIKRHVDNIAYIAIEKEKGEE